MVVSLELKSGISTTSAQPALQARIKETFEISARLVFLEPKTLAKEFEGSVKAPRFVDRRS